MVCGVWARKGFNYFKGRSSACTVRAFHRNSHCSSHPRSRMGRPRQSSSIRTLKSLDRSERTHPRNNRSPRCTERAAEDTAQRLHRNDFAHRTRRSSNHSGTRTLRRCVGRWCARSHKRGCRNRSSNSRGRRCTRCPLSHRRQWCSGSSPSIQASNNPAASHTERQGVCRSRDTFARRFRARTVRCNSPSATSTRKRLPRTTKRSNSPRHRHDQVQPRRDRRPRGYTPR